MVAAYAGTTEMLERVSEVVRVTQNNRVTCAYAQAAARVLERLILDGAHSSGADAVLAAADALDADDTGNGEAQIADELAATAKLASSTSARSNLTYLDSVIAFCGGRYNAVSVS